MFEILEHTADIGFRAQAPALPELFESAALALVSIAMETDNIVNRHSYSLEAYGDSNETLLVNWLNDVLYQLDGAHAAMMVHPAPLDSVTPKLIAGAQFIIRYIGKSAHAAATPELGINAADALTIAQVAIGLLRQHIRGSDRIHGIVTDGGDAPNIIPAHSAARYIVRSDTFAELNELIPRVMRCFEAGALATGATLDVTGGDKPYAHLDQDAEMADLYRRNGEALGRVFTAEPVVASTDMGNVSLVIPTIHPMIGIDSLPAVNHQPEFTAACATPVADQALFDGALAMAWTAIDLATTDTLRERLLSKAYRASPLK